MNSYEKRNNWSCMLAAFCHACDWDQDWVIEKLGHDGSEIIFPGVPEPRCRRGYHVQELVNLAIEWGFCCTPWEICPTIQHPIDPTWVHACYPVSGDPIHQMERYIRSCKGVIEVRTRSGAYHAMPFKRGEVYEPIHAPFKGDIHQLTQRGFAPYRLWIIE